MMDENTKNYWRVWIAENLISGADPQTLKKVMLANELGSDFVEEEFSKAVNHPYIEAGKKMKYMLNKRDWLLNTMDKFENSDPGFVNTEKVPIPSFADFLRDYYYRNRPGVFSGGVDHWKAMSWTPEILRQKVGEDALVKVQANREKNKRYELERVKHEEEMKFGEFIDKIDIEEKSNNYYLTANNHGLENEGLKKLLDEIDNISDGYFNMDEKEGRSFLWVGPGGIRTPLHHDQTNNFFVQMYGRKKFSMIPSKQVTKMYNFEAVFSPVDFAEPDLNKYPDFALTTPYEIILEPGDCLFIPVGWWHYVEGLDVNISMSFTNFNADNHNPGYPGGIGGAY